MSRSSALICSTSFLAIFGRKEFISSNRSRPFASVALSSCWKAAVSKINDSIWVDYDSPFNLSNYDYGYYLIYYYAIDAVGHTETENTLVVNLVEIESEPHDNGDPTISGYFFPLLLTAISLIIIIKITKKLKN